MKRFLLRMVCVCFMIAHVLNASAYDVIVNGIYYDLHLAEKTASVTYRNRSTASYSGEIDLPSAISIAGIQYSVTSIGDYAFYDCSGLTSLTIPEGVTSIGKRAFYNCRSLTTLTIPEGVTSIGDYAFYNCSGLTSVSIPEGVTSIGDYAFYNCSGLTSVSIPEGVTSIGPGAFSYCSGLTSVSIPEGVTSIGYNAFSVCRNLTSVTIPNSVTSIGSSAFAGCESLPKIDGILYADTYLVGAVDQNLSEIQWKEGTRFIGSNAFSKCYYLTSVTIPNSVTSIGNGAFSNCTRLTSVTIPNSVTDIGKDAFSGCVRLPVVDGIRYADTYLVEAVDKETISELSWKEGTRFIGSSAFSGCSNLTTVTIPNSVTLIGDLAFSGCSGLTSVVMPDGVTSIGYQSFADCSVLSTVNIPNTVTSIGNSAFYNCKGLTSVTISNSVTSIGIGVFQNCKGLTSVTIPNSVTSIGTQAFSSSGLTSVTIPNSVTSIGNDAFGYCKSLTSVTIPNSVKSIEELAFSDCSELTTVTISEGVTSIGFRAFYRCSSLTTVNIPNTVTSIWDNAFEDCTSLPIIDGIRYADTYLLEAVDKDNLSEIQWKEGTRFIRSSAFSSCSELTSVTIPNSVASIPGSAFSGCTGLTSVSIPNSVVIIGLSAFAGTSISSIYVDANIPYICGSTSFSDTDKSNGTLYVPIGYKTAYQTAEYWSEFQNIEEYDSSNEDISVIASGTCGADGDNLTWELTDDNVLKISGSGAMADYFSTNDAPWYPYAKHIKDVVLEEGVTSIGNRAFYCYSGVSSVVIPNSVKSIGDYAFGHCISLTSVTISYGVMSIGECAFTCCEQLTSVTIPNSVTSIGYAAFGNCGLTSVTIPSSVKSIGEGGVFLNCSGLTSITVDSGNQYYDSRNNCNAIIETASNRLISGCMNTVIPNSVTGIGDYAFWGCTGLTSITISSKVTSIGREPFWRCSGLTSITVDSGNQYYDSRNNCNAIIETATSRLIAGCMNTVIPNGVTIIADGAFGYCTGLTKMEIPNSVTYIGVSAFEECSSLTTIGIPASVATIRDFAFMQCTSLTSVTIPNGMTRIDGYVFSGCSGLTDVSIPNSLTIIGPGAFWYTNLTSLTIPNKVTRIGREAFAPFLIPSIYVGTTIPTIDADCFTDEVYSNSTLYVPAGSKDAYQSAENWSLFQHVEEYSRLRIDDFRANIGKTIEVPIYLENTEEMTSLEFDLYLPEGITVPYTTGRNGAINYTSSIIKGSDRFDDDSDHAISAKMTEDGALRVLLHSNTNMAFYDTDVENQDCRKTSPLLTLKLQISSDMEEGSQYIDLRNVIAASYTDGVTKKHELIDWSAQIDLHATRVVTVVSADAEKGSVLIEGENYNAETHEVPYGEAVTLTATPSTGYHFVHWIAGETVLSTENPYQLTVDDDHAIQAVFAVNQYSVRFVADGTAVYDELQDYGSAIALPEAPDKPGYAFYSWGEVDETVPAHNVEYVADYVLVGDVYTDATIDIADVTSLVGLVLNDVTPTGRELLQADVYADKQIDIADVTGAVGLVLNSSHSAAPRDMESFGTGVISLTAEESMNIENSAHCLSIGLNNADCMIQALQFDITLPEGVELASANLHRNLHATDRLDHSLTASRLDEHTVRVMLYSLAANTIDGEEGEILSIDLQTTSSAVGSIIEVTNIKAVTTDGEPHELTSVEVVVGNVTGIGLLTVAQYVTVYDLEGRKVLSEYLSAGFDLKQRLGAGTYVVNGKKINIIY